MLNPADDVCIKCGIPFEILNEAFELLNRMVIKAAHCVQTCDCMVCVWLRNHVDYVDIPLEDVDERGNFVEVSKSIREA